MNPGLSGNASAEDVENVFYSLLHRAGAQWRVVLLLDALDQSEQTPRGKYLTWLKPGRLPAAARVIATAIPCQATEALAKAAGVRMIDLEPLTLKEAEEIAHGVWAQYHRQISPEVLGVLTGKRSSAGKPAYGNPLWLTLALEQLNLLDADDFERAERTFAGSSTERMRALLLETAERMPADIEGLYGWLLAQTEKTFGVARARAFATVIALSRAGWRETDLLDLVPRIAPLMTPPGNGSGGVLSGVSPFDDLQLAALRRGFRAHLVRRGEGGHLDFFHAQMRRAVERMYLADENLRRVVHSSISDYLETLPESDPMVPVERMRQLIGEHDALRAARYYATLDASGNAEPGERVGSSWTLIDWILEGERDPSPSDTKIDNRNVQWVAEWMSLPGLTSDECV